MNVVMFSTHCPRCKVLGMMLDKAGIQYTVNTDVDEMERREIASVPAL